MDTHADRWPLAVVFDLDDTLYPERRFALSGFRAAAKAAQAMGADETRVGRALIRAFRRGARQDIFQRVCESEHLGSDLVPLMLDAFRSHTPRLRLPLESQVVLAECRRRGLVAVLTNGDPVIQRRKVAALGVEALVDCVVYAAEHHPAGKPDRACFTAVERALHTSSEYCVMVGDTLAKDVVGAQAAGWHCMWKRTARDASCVDVPAGVILATRLAEVPQLAEKILQEGSFGYEHAHRITADRRGAAALRHR